LIVTKVVLSALVFTAQIELPVEVRALLRPHHDVAAAGSGAAVYHVKLAYSYMAGVDKLTTVIVGACEDAVAAQPDCAAASFLGKLRGALQRYQATVREERDAEDEEQLALGNGKHAPEELVKVCRVLRTYHSKVLLQQTMQPHDLAAVADLSRNMMARVEGDVSVSVGGESPSSFTSFGNFLGGV
jgi:hypothetical protein